MNGIPAPCPRALLHRVRSFNHYEYGGSFGGENMQLNRAIGYLLVPLILFFVLAAPAVQAGSLTIPHTFTANTPAKADEVNANFAAVETSVDGNAGDIAALQAAVATLQSTVSAQQTTISGLQSWVGDQACHHLQFTGRFGCRAVHGQCPANHH